MAKKKVRRPNKDLVIKESVGMGEKAYKALRDAIEQGVMKPGQRIREGDIADWLAMSRTPIREGLRRLQVEGLVENAAGSGLSVASHDLSAIGELYTFREHLEGTAAALAAENANAAEVRLLSMLVEAERKLPTDDPDVHDLHNKTFHLRMHQASHNRFALKAYQTLRDATVLLGRTTLVIETRRTMAIEQHQRIVEAIRNHDAAAAAEAARDHIRTAYKARVELLSQEIPLDAVSYPTQLKTTTFSS